MAKTLLYYGIQTGNQAVAMAQESPTVLVVDDEDIICDLVCEGLAEQGYACYTASNADDALARLKRQSFDVVLLDIRLPDMSGMELLKTIRESRFYREQATSVIMITGVSDIATA